MANAEQHNTVLIPTLVANNNATNLPEIVRTYVSPLFKTGLEGSKNSKPLLFHSRRRKS